MAPPISWDTDAGLRMWVAERPIAEIARALLVSRRTIQSFARYHGWPVREGFPAGGIPQPRKLLLYPPIPPARPKQPKLDPAVKLYRAEKKRKAAKDEAQLADARRLYLVLEAASKPKAGRPRKPSPSMQEAA